MCAGVPILISYAAAVLWMACPCVVQEPRCQSGSGNGNCAASVVTPWINMMAAYFKSLDPNHMVSTLRSA